MDDLFENQDHGLSAGEPVECLGQTFPNDAARREHFLGLLREKLKDPEFRKIEGFPIGTDEDILALSDPPYYTACPNPFLADFIKHYGKPYDPNVPYSREPFAADVSEGKNDPIYNAHAYHTKVSYLAIRRYIEHFTEPGDLVLDFFAGTGMTGVAAQRCESGERRCVLVDLSSVATHVAGAFTSPFSLKWIRQEAQRVLSGIRTRHDWMYETTHCGWPAGERTPLKRVNDTRKGESPTGTINFVVWSDVFLCHECGVDIIFWRTAVDFSDECVLDDFQCPHCNALLRKRGLAKATTLTFDQALKQTHSVAKREPVLINYTYNGKRYEKEPDEEDLAVLEKIEGIEIENWFPTVRMPEGDESRRNDPAGITHVHHFYTKRNLLALSTLRTPAEQNRALLFWFTSTLPWCGRDNRLHIGNYFGKRGGQITSLRGTWYVPSLSVETNVFERFDLRLTSALVESGSRSQNCIVSTNSATTLQGIPPNTVDYIFVDPPFGENLMYSELNCIWEAWLRVRTSIVSEAIMNKTQKKDLFAYQVLMTLSFKEGYRVLKPGRWITIEFHNSKNSVWNAIQEALQSAGFVIADVRTLDKGKGSFKQVTSTGSVKQDLIISAYKPNGGLEERFKLEAGTEDGVWDFIRTHLKHLPVFVSQNGTAEVIAERQTYLLFDRMVAFHVQRGVTVPLSASEFYAGLLQRFSERDGMYFLSEQVAEYDKKRMSTRELMQLEIAIVGESSAIEWLRQQLLEKPQTFQDLTPQFMRELAGWQKFEKPLELRELLEQNFLRYDGQGDVPSQIHSYLSTNFKDLRNKPKDDPALKAKAKDRWYVPDPNKAGDLEKLRERALLREFAEYLPPGYKPIKAESLEGFIPGLEPSTSIPKGKKLKVFRLEAVRAGFKLCWQNRDYRTIIAVAQRIPETILQEDPKLLMWYDQALTRTGD